jgi:hypothetical protein
LLKALAHKNGFVGLVFGRASLPAVALAKPSLQDLKEIRGNRFEKLKGRRKGQYNIRIDDQYRF